MSYKMQAEEKRRLRKAYVVPSRRIRLAGVYYNKRKKRYMRYSYPGKRGRGKYYRTAGNRKVRRTASIANHGGYKKVYDYRWKVT
jgi:hypothetical protein